MFCSDSRGTNWYRGKRIRCGQQLGRVWEWKNFRGSSTTRNQFNLWSHTSSHLLLMPFLNLTNKNDSRCFTFFCTFDFLLKQIINSTDVSLWMSMGIIVEASTKFTIRKIPDTSSRMSVFISSFFSFVSRVFLWGTCSSGEDVLLYGLLKSLHKRKCKRKLWRTLQVSKGFRF